MGMMLPGMFFSASFGRKNLNQICRSELIGMLCHTKLQSHFQSTNSPISSNIKMCVKLSLTMLQVDQKAQFWAFILSHTQVSSGRLNDPPHGTFKNWWKRKLRTLPVVTWRIKPAKSSKFSMPYGDTSDRGGCRINNGIWDTLFAGKSILL